MSTLLDQSDGHIFQDVHVYASGQARVLLGNSIESGQTDFAGVYAYSSLRPVTTYVSRPDLERQLREQLPPLDDSVHNPQTRTVVVWGLGGSGKSQLVLHYVQKHRQDYEAIFWVEAGQKQTVERDYLQIYNLLFPNPAGTVPAPNTDNAVAAIKNWFHQRTRRCLWVIDSADVVDDDDEGSESFIDLNHFLPDAPGLDRIVTTRSSRLQSFSPQACVAVAEMTQNEAVELFRRRAKLTQPDEETASEVETIVEELGYFALAINLTAAYISELPRLSSEIQLFLPEYHEHRKRLLSRKAQRSTDRYCESVQSTLECSFTGIEQRHPAAARLLTLLAFINFDDIFLDLFAVSSGPVTVSSANPTADPSWQAKLWPDLDAIDQYTFESNFALLQGFSLISWRTDQKSFSMHKLVHACIHDRLTVTEQREWCLTALDMLAQSARNCPKTPDIYARFVPHISAIFGGVTDSYDVDKGISDSHLLSIEELAHVLCYQGQGDLEQVARAFLLRVRQLASHHKGILALLSKFKAKVHSTCALARRLGDQGRFREAEEILWLALQLCEESYGQKHPETRYVMENLAIITRKAGKDE